MHDTWQAYKHGQAESTSKRESLSETHAEINSISVKLRDGTNMGIWPSDNDDKGAWEFVHLTTESYILLYTLVLLVSVLNISRTKMAPLNTFIDIFLVVQCKNVLLFDSWN